MHINPDEKGSAMNDYIIGHIRTIVPVAIGAFLVWVGNTTGLAGLDQLAPELVPAVTGFIIAVYYALVRALAERWGFVGVLLGYNKAPAYKEPA